MNSSTSLPALVPLGPGPVYEGIPIWLPQLFAETVRGGTGIVEGRTFVQCQFEGPAVILPVEGCSFDGCNMGETGGDVRNLLTAPVGDKIIGVIPFRNCTFRDCVFYMVGFTGSANFLEEFRTMVGGNKA